MNPKAFDQAGSMANLIIAILGVISLFFEPTVGIGMLVGAIMRKNNLTLGDKSGSLLTIAFIVVLGIALYLLIDGYAVIGYVIAVCAYFLIKFLLYFIFERREG